MSNLRIIGLIVGIIGLIVTFRIYRGPRWRRLNFVLFGLFSLSLIAVSLNPNLLNTAAQMLRLERPQRGRILALLIGSNIFLWFILLYFKNRLDEYRHQFDLLIRSLGEEELVSILKKKEVEDKEIIVVIPAYNEADNLKELLRKIPKRVCNKKIEVLVIDDGSTDDTAQVAREAGYLVVRNKTRRGGGAALRLGYDVARYLRPQIIVTMDADGQHQPEEIERLIKPILEERYDFVIGSRILGKAQKVSILRFVGIPIFNFIIQLLTGVKITDCSSGFRAFRIDLLNEVVLTEEQYHTPELIIDAVKKQMKIGEVPVTISERKHGKSKKGKDLKYGFNFAKTIIKAWWR
ncbi:glycosyl transferase family 2 [Candidatus Bathyarchaeota archaeon]|nr:MAG: glycosyl transferase family 2 [Candidatus Bathyarchaeota archaeon]